MLQLQQIIDFGANNRFWSKGVFIDKGLGIWQDYGEVIFLPRSNVFSKVQMQYDKIFSGHSVAYGNSILMINLN